MSLHPHIPHQVKQFAEHLFATFLGLLMALALEQWREHRHELKIAGQALEGVRAELLANAKVLRDNQAIAADTARYWNETQAYMDELVLARAQKRAAQAPTPQRPDRMGAELNFRTGAWDSAKSLGLPRHLGTKELQDLTETYASLVRIQAVQDQTLVQVQGTDHRPWAQPQIYEALSIDQLYLASRNMRAVANLKGYTASVHEDMAPKLEKLAKSLQLP
ncbi:hypothetical protein HNQ51_002490 [Inhella inkyongensis]|uniref:Uncharacterized protein n=1 Tax=Inhella inkyongensis TaxID=392593 RepID=A0A840S9H5_9BURK|nr:hypothetical protein [Inhella inkyongensis]MBB5205171.1 hypothetical protein [Inhella inkyongensis]